MRSLQLGGVGGAGVNHHVDGRSLLRPQHDVLTIAAVAVGEVVEGNEVGVSVHKPCSSCFTVRKLSVLTQGTNQA